MTRGPLIMAAWTALSHWGTRLARKGGTEMGLRSRWWNTFFGVPRGLFGRLGTRLMIRVSRQFSQAMAEELELQSDDELLDVGCGSAGLLVDQAAHVRYVAGLDASELQVSMARL